MTVKLPSADDVNRPMPTVSRHVSGYNVAVNTDVGKAITGFGAQVIEEQERLDDIKAEDAVNKAKLKALELYHGKDGYGSKKGEAVTVEPIHKNYTERFSQAMDEVERGLGNKSQIQKFRRRIQPLNLNYQNSLLGHIAKETENYADLTDTTTLDVERSSAAANFANPEAVADARERSLYAINSTIKRKDMGGKVKDAFKLKELTKFHVGVINSMLVSNPEMAKEYFKNNSKEIDGTKHDDIRSLLESGTVLGIAQTVTDEIINKKLGLDKSLELGRKKAKTPEERKAIEGEIKSRFHEVDLVHASTEKEALVHMNNNGTLATFPQDKKDILGADAILRLEATQRRKNRGVETIQDPMAWYDFSEQLRKASLGDKAAIEWIKTVHVVNKYQDKFDDAHLDRAIAAKQAWMIGDKKAQAATNKNTEEVLSNKAAADIYINKLVDVEKTGKRDEDDNEFANWFYTNAQINFEIWQAENKGAAMPPSTRDYILRQLAQEHNVKDAGFMYYDKDLDIEDIKMVYLKEITAKLRKNRVPVTGINILKEFSAGFIAGEYDD